MLGIETLNEILSFVESDFSIDSQIIESGQRVVYKAKLKGNNDDIFVLKISPTYPTNVARIKRELKILSELNSSYFPTSHYSQFISDEDIKYFIDNFDPKIKPEKIKHLSSLNLQPFFITVEDYIDHLNWDELQKYFNQNEEEFISFLKKVFEALNFLWNKKIVHRDLKPENILVKNNFEPTIIDLGIAKSLRDGTQMLTHPLMASPCTPQFAAPEQIISNKAEITYKSDQFSIGVMAFWIATKTYPFGILDKISLEEFLKNISKNRIAKIRDYNANISNGLQKFIYKLLSVHPYQRYRSYDMIRAALEDMGRSK